MCELKRINIGDIVRHFKHFKYETLSEQEKRENKYTYVIRGFARHTETEEELVIYQALYGNFGTYARPMKMFFSEVDREKYTNIKQRYRFEKCD